MVGVIMMESTDQELFDLILGLEDKLQEQGMEPKARAFELPMLAMEKLGYVSFIAAGPGVSPLLERIRRLQSSLYRRSDVAIGGLHGGAFMFRGIAVSIHIPMMVGTVSIDPMELCDLSTQQIKWLQQREQDATAYIATFADIFDFAATLHPMSGYQFPSKSVVNVLQLSSFQLQGAAAALCAAFDGRGAIQSGMIGAELALKAALVGKGVSDANLKNMGHNQVKLAAEVHAHYPDFEIEVVQARLDKFPDFVANRYAADQPNRDETGEIVMAAQFIAGAVARCVSGGSFFKLAEQVTPTNHPD